MTASARRALYSPQLLALAVELAQFPLQADAQFVGQVRSRTCGSMIALGTSEPERIASLGMKVSACAVGQAAAAIFAGGASGMDAAGIEGARDEMEAWLAGSAKLPSWPRLALLEPALPHRGRHEAILLPWRAAVDALSKGKGSR